MSALQYVDEPNYSALMLRRTYGELALPGALMDMAAEWLQPFRKTKEVHWSEKNKTYTFPSGATLTFGFLEHPNDKYRYQGAQFQGIFYDEVTQFDEEDYKYLFSRSRRTLKMAENVPLRFRSASNPGGIGHCVPFGEVLTPYGWKNIKEFKINDNVYTIDNNGTLIEAMVSQVHKEYYSGELVNLKTRNLNIICTPEHKIAKIGGTKQNLNNKFSLVKFKDLPGQTTIMRTVNWEGKKLDYFIVPEIKQKIKSRLNQPNMLSGNNYIKLLGWMLSEGYTSIRPEKNDYIFGICQSKKENRIKIKQLLDDCKFKYRETPTYFSVASKSWAYYFKQLGKCRDKYIPYEVKQLNKKQLQILFDTMMLGDGCKTIYYTTSKQLADDFAEMGIKLGYIVYSSQRRRKNRLGLSYQISCVKTKSGGTELLTGNHCYNVKTVTKRISNIKKEKFNGNVYCIGIDGTHTFILRQNGSVWVSGNSWVKKRFLTEGRAKGRVFIPAVLSDNKYLDYDSYVENLNELSPLEREQLLNGDWEINSGGKVFKREWFEIIDKLPETTNHITRVRYWDMAASEENKIKGYGYDPAFTVGLKMAKIVRKGQKDLYVIEDIKRFQKLPDDVEATILATAMDDGRDVEIWMEQEPASSGKTVINDYVKTLKGYTFRGQKEGGSKVLRASKVAATAGNGCVKLLHGHWNDAYLDEIEYFPDSKYKDQVDCTSGAFDKLRFFAGYAVLPAAIAQETGSYWLGQSG